MVKRRPFTIARGVEKTENIAHSRIARSCAVIFGVDWVKPIKNVIIDVV